MRKQSAAIRKRNVNILRQERQRKHAIVLLEQNQPMQHISAITGMSLGSISRLNQQLQAAKRDKNQDILHTNIPQMGRPTTFSEYDELLIVKRFTFIASRGFEADVELLRTIAAKIAAANGKQFKNGRRSDDWIRSFRALHRDLTLRRVENKEPAKLFAEHPDHVATFVCALKNCEKHNPGILDDPQRFFNMDETEVGGKHGRMHKAFVGVETHCGGYNMSFTKPGKHVTACVIANADGTVLPPFLIFAGKRSMEHWYDPLPAEIYKDQTGIPHWLTEEEWYPGKASEWGTENGSMTIETIAYVMSHINHNVKRKPPPDHKLLLVLDGHKSRNGALWLEKAEMFDIEVVQSPSHTTHFLQTFDNDINSTFETAIRNTHDFLKCIAHIDFSQIGNRLKLAIAGYKSLSPSVVRKAFNDTGMWPMDFRFHKWAVERHSGKENSAFERDTRITVRRTARHVMNAKAIIEKESPPAKAWEDLSSYVLTANKAQDIIENCTPMKKKMVRFVVDERTSCDPSSVAPGAYLTHRDCIAPRRKKEEEAEQERKAKAEQRKRREEERKRKAEQAQNVKEAKLEERQRRQADRERKRDEQNQARERKAQERAKKKAESEEKNREKKRNVSSKTNACCSAAAVRVRSVSANGDSRNGAASLSACGSGTSLREKLASRRARIHEKESKNNGENEDDEVARALLRMHNLGPDIAATHTLLVKESVGDQACLDDAEYVPFTLVPKQEDVPTFPGKGVGGEN